MKIYTNEIDSHKIYKKALVRLLQEGNEPSIVHQWVSRGVEIEDLDNYINNTGCSTVNEMLENGEVAYVVTQLESDDDFFAYVGVR